MPKPSPRRALSFVAAVMACAPTNQAPPLAPAVARTTVDDANESPTPREDEPAPQPVDASEPSVEPAEDAGPAEGHYIAAGGASSEPEGSVPRVKQAQATSSGSLDKDIVRRIVRAHINEVRFCYNEALKVDPELQGRVVVEFAIEPSGEVDVAKVVAVEPTEGRMTQVADCVAEATKRWRFPHPPDGDTVTVVYPFILAPG